MSKTVSHHHDHQQAAASRVIFGFWIFLMTDCITFAALFATYAVLNNGMDLHCTSMDRILVQTFALLTAAFLARGALLALQKESTVQAFIWLIFSGLFGSLFACLDYISLHSLYAQGLTWQTNGYLSAFYTLLGMHFAHVGVALLWTVVLLIQLCLQGPTQTMKTRFMCLGLFWGFVNILWVSIFTIVYLMGGVPHV
jgi:cytochrome o ubiquinol oxidase subunit 3